MLGGFGRGEIPQLGREDLTLSWMLKQGGQVKAWCHWSDIEIKGERRGCRPCGRDYQDQATQSHSFSSSAHQEGEMMSAAQGDREVAFPYLNLNGLGCLPEWRARDSPRQER